LKEEFNVTGFCIDVVIWVCSPQHRMFKRLRFDRCFVYIGESSSMITAKEYADYILRRFTERKFSFVFVFR
jgi:hypothetical protein